MWTLNVSVELNGRFAVSAVILLGFYFLFCCYLSLNTCLLYMKGGELQTVSVQFTSQLFLFFARDSPSPPPNPRLENILNLYRKQVTMWPFTGPTGHCPSLMQTDTFHLNSSGSSRRQNGWTSASPQPFLLFLPTNLLIMLPLRCKNARFCSLLCPSHLEHHGDN